MKRDVLVGERRRGWAPVQETLRAGSVRPEIAEVAYREYSRLFGTDQSLARLNQRGGFDWAELVEFLYAEVTRLQRAGAKH